MFECIKNFWNSLLGTTPSYSKKPSQIVNYMANDPTYPVFIRIPLPTPPPNLRFNVSGFAGHDYSNRFNRQAGNCYITMASNLHYVQNVLESPLNSWAAVRNLRAVPRAGRMLNAYYDRRNLMFFWDEIRGNTIYTVESSDIIAHELGHAILDAMRPDFWSVQALEIWAYHEAFSDINSMLAILYFDEVLDKVVSERIDLRRSNFISQIGEELGSIIFGRGKPLRDAVNKFNYISPINLPQDAGPDRLAAQPHSFGRIFVGTWYDILVDIYERDVNEGDRPLQALRNARDTMARLMLHATVKAPRVVNFHEAIARTMLVLAREEKSPYLDILNENFAKRKIITPHVKALSMKKKQDLDIKETDILEFEDEDVAIVHQEKTLKLSDHIKGIQALSVNGISLSDVELEVATDQMYMFDKEGNVMEEIVPTESSIVEAAQACVASIYSTSNIGTSKSTMWEVQNNKLVRTYVD